MYVDEIHLNPLGDMKYAELVFGFLSDMWKEGAAASRESTAPAEAVRIPSP
jgi:hypothetical protein